MRTPRIGRMLLGLACAMFAALAVSTAAARAADSHYHLTGFGAEARWSTAIAHAQAHVLASQDEGTWVDFSVTRYRHGSVYRQVSATGYSPQPQPSRA